MLSEFMFAVLAVIAVLAKPMSHANQSCHVCRSKP